MSWKQLLTIPWITDADLGIRLGQLCHHLIMDAFMEKLKCGKKVVRQCSLCNYSEVLLHFKGAWMKNGSSVAHIQQILELKRDGGQGLWNSTNTRKRRCKTSLRFKTSQETKICFNFTPSQSSVIDVFCKHSSFWCSRTNTQEILLLQFEESLPTQYNQIDWPTSILPNIYWINPTLTRVYWHWLTL